MRKTLTRIRKNLAAYNNALESPGVRKYFVVPDASFPTRADI